MGRFIRMFTVTAMCAVGIWAQEIDWSAANITITNEAQLRELARLTKSKQRNFSGQTVTLGNDVHIKDGSKNKWTPIGDFAGTFDGNGRVISGIYIGNTGRSQGLFSYVDNGGLIKNLGVIVHIEGYNEVAGLAVLNFGTIENCYVSGSIIGRDFVGGLVAANCGVIENCFVQGTVKGYNFTGGIVGANSGKIENSYVSSSDRDRDFMNLIGFQNSDPNVIREAREKAAAEKAAAEKAAREKVAAEKTAAEQKKAAMEQAARDKAAAEQTTQNKTSSEQSSGQQVAVKQPPKDSDYEKRQQKIVKFTTDLPKIEKALAEIKSSAPATYGIASLSVELLKTLNRMQEKKTFDSGELPPLIIQASLMSLPPQASAPLKTNTDLAVKTFSFLTANFKMPQNQAAEAINSAFKSWNGKSVMSIKDEMKTVPPAQKVKVAMLLKSSIGIFANVIPQLNVTVKASL